MQVIDRPYILDRFSPSMITTYLNCPLAFYYQYIAKIQLPAGKQLTLGSAVHYGIEKTFDRTEDPKEAMHKKYVELNGEANMSDEDKEQLAIGDLLLENFQIVKPDFDKTYDWDNGISEKKVRRMLTHPISGEQMPIPFSGILDRLTNDGVIFEFKTASKKWDTDAVNFRAQTLLYNLWYFSEKGCLPKETVYVILIKNGKKGRDGVQILNTKHDIVDLAGAYEEISVILDKIKNGIFERPNGWHPPWCDCHKYEELLALK